MSPIEVLGGGDHYQVLGVGRCASEAEIVKSYKRLALLHHPDKNRDDTERAEENFKLLTEAFEVLRDAEKRKGYDLSNQVSGRQVREGPCSGAAEKEPPGDVGFGGGVGGGGGGGGLFDTDSDDVFTSLFGHADPFAGFFPASQARRERPWSTSQGGYPAQPTARRSAASPLDLRESTFPCARAPESTFPERRREDSDGGLFGGGGGGLFGAAGGRATPSMRREGFAATPGKVDGGPGATGWPLGGAAAGSPCATAWSPGRIGGRAQGGGSTGSSCQPPTVVPAGTAVVVHASDDHPEHDGKAARLLSWDAATGLYEVELESRLKIRLPRRSVVQKTRVEITDLQSRPDVNGRLGDIFGCDEKTGRYQVLIKTGAVPVSLGLHCGNCILKIGTRVIVQGLQKDVDLNGAGAQITSVDLRMSRYTLELTDGKQIKVKYGNVRC